MDEQELNDYMESDYDNYKELNGELQWTDSAEHNYQYLTEWN